MAENPPYLASPGMITKALEKIKSAATPERVTQDFISTKLGMKGGTAMMIIPFLKRTGFLNSDGSPSEIYKQFRNPSQTGRAAAAALRTGYKALYERNEYLHDLKDDELKGVIVEATGLEKDNKVVYLIQSAFKALKQFAKLDEDGGTETKERREDEEEKDMSEKFEKDAAGLNLSYTINLNLPATSDVKVFDAIFRSLREHLLRK